MIRLRDRMRGLLASLGVMVVLAACGVPLSTTPVPVASAGGSTTTSIDRSLDDASLPVHIYFLRNGRFDSVERRDTASSASHPEVAIRNTIESLKAGLLPRERAKGFTSPLESIVADTDLSIGVSVSNGVAVVDLTEIADVLRTLKVDQRQKTVAQIALTTLLGTPGIGGVRFVVAGEFLALSGPSARGDTEFHVADFPCLDEDATCELSDIALPAVEIVADTSVPDTTVG